MSTVLMATAFHNRQLLATGELPAVALQVKHLLEKTPEAAVLVFGDHDGRVIDLDLRGSDEDMVARLPSPALAETGEQAARGPGRPKLGVVAREVTLLPRHWEWLAAQPGGASVVLRKLVEDARRANPGAEQRRQAQEAAYRFMSAMAGDEAGFEDASRALFAADEQAFIQAQNSWPQDIRHHVHQLAAPVFAAS